MSGVCKSYKLNTRILWAWSHEDIHCPNCGRDMSQVETFRSGHGIEGGRYMKKCPSDGFMYYNLGAEIGKQKGDENVKQERYIFS